MRYLWLCGLLILAMLAVTGCAAGPNELARTADSEGEIVGFWAGLWQGIISPLTFIISLFAQNVHFYEVHNNGNWYNFGFVLGAGILTSGGIFGARKGHGKH